jgi:hypothetical protein
MTSMHSVKSNGMWIARVAKLLRWCSRLRQSVSSAVGPVVKRATSQVRSEDYLQNSTVRAASYDWLSDSLKLDYLSWLQNLTKIERASANEPEDISRVARTAISVIVANYCKEKRVNPHAEALRFQHAKHQGCLSASFIVRPDIPQGLSAGVFQPGKRYRAIVRFSNAMGVPQSDRAPDGQGMAIKLLGVEGRRLTMAGSNASNPVSSFVPSLDDQPLREQDFLLVNFPVFFGKDVSDFAQFARYLKSGKGIDLLRFFAPPRRWRQLLILMAHRKQKVESPLCISYFSMTAFLHGADTVVRYVASPAGGARRSTAAAARSDFPTNYLRDAVGREVDASTHAPGSKVVFDFSVQVRNSPTPDDVEDASRRWCAKADRTIPLARIEIPMQSFDTASKLSACEARAFNPWNCLADHRPIGGLNRMRLAVYLASMHARHRLNMFAVHRSCKI